MERRVMDRATLTVRELAEELGICLPSAYELVHRRGFPSISLGRRIIVPRAAFESWLEKQAEQGA